MLIAVSTLQTAESRQCCAGLLPHGLLVMMPSSMHLSASCSQPPTALTAALACHILPIQLSPAAVLSLHAISKAIHTSATFPSQQITTDEHAQSPHGGAGRDIAQPPGPAARSPQAVSHEPVHVGIEKSASGSHSGTAALQDDLRCGLFSLASVPGSRPGEPMIAKGRLQ